MPDEADILIANQADPTHTVTLRNQFERDMARRFQRLISVIREALVERDVLAIQSRTSFEPSVMQPPQRKQFDFPTSDSKARGFMVWLRDQVNKGILEATVNEEGNRVPLRGEPWTNVYIRSAYQKGLESARTEMNKAGVPPPGVGATGAFETSQQALNLAFNQPVHADRAGLLYSRTFTELEGVTEAMAQRMRRTLSQGIAEGINPREIATRLNQDVRNIGINRARTISRTEVIRAHHQSTIREYEQAGVEGVTVQAEWLTAGDGRVCPRCEALEGEVFDLEEIENMIPLHPNCRCKAIAIQPGAQ